MSEQQITLRDALAANYEAAENGTLGQVQEAPPIETATEDQAAIDRARDERGRFAPEESAPGAAEVTTPAATPQVTDAVPAAEPQLQRPTTWKKDYLPIWDKLATGQPLTAEEARKLAEYSNQREKEFATGVSTYKAEAVKAQELQKALEPFMPELQRYNVNPAEWVSNLGNTHKALVTGTPEQKVQIFSQLMKDYRVDLNNLLQHLGIGAEQAGQVAPVVNQLMQKMQQLEHGVNTVTSWREQQEQERVQAALSKFEDTEKYPHYQQVRGTMAQLLESGLAQDLDTAYTKAVRMVDDVWQQEQERQAQAQAAAQQQASKAAAVAKAKATAVSPRSTTPSGAVTNAGPKDRRSMLAEAIDSAASGRV
jgi:hypothetical protein